MVLKTSAKIEIYSIMRNKVLILVEKEFHSSYIKQYFSVNARWSMELNVKKKEKKE